MSKKQSKKTAKTNNTLAKVAASGRTAAKKRGRANASPAPATDAGDEATGTAVDTAGGAAEPRMPLPPVGTVIEKRDRYGALRCKCTVEENGLRYNRTMYRSLSAAAMAAAKDLGLKNKTQNGWVFWGLSKAPRPTSDPLEALDLALERYNGRVATVLEASVTAENRTQIAAALRKHGEKIEALRQQVL